jgi:hypothetical protein
MNRKLFVKVLFLSCFTLLSIFQTVYSQTSYPTKSVKIIVPFGAGGTGDILARIFGQYLEGQTKQSVFIENKPGASGILGTEAAKNAEPDGYTLLLSTNTTHAANVSLFKKLPYDPVKDFAASTSVRARTRVVDSISAFFACHDNSRTARRYRSVAARVMWFLFISICTPVRVGSESSLPAAIATWFTALAKTSLATRPAVSGNSGSVGYSDTERVGRVNFADPAVTSTRVPSNTKVIGLFGRERAISANNLPGTRTLPFEDISAFKIVFVEVSRSDPVRVIEVSTSIMIPRSSVLIGLVDKLRATQLTASTNSSRSTTNFIFYPVLSINR